MRRGLEVAFFGSSLVSAYWNGAATCYRGILRGGNGWEDRELPRSVKRLGHVYTRGHNALNASALCVLNVNRDIMARFGHSPATRVFEAAGAGACLLTDAFVGVEAFLLPGEEILVATDGDDVAAQVSALTPSWARAVGERARRRVLAEHTYTHRAAQVDALWRGVGP